jgi:hypothetical protein
MVVRTWFCLNKFCRHTFDMADADHPPCVRCGGIHVKWIPKQVNILGERTKQADRDVRALQQVYGDKNYRSPQRHEAVAPKLNPVVTPGKTIPFTPMQGWSADIPVDASGAPMTVCAPTGVTAKLPVNSIGQRVPVDKRSATSTGAIPKYEARHQGVIEK